MDYFFKKKQTFMKTFLTSKKKNIFPKKSLFLEAKPKFTKKRVLHNLFCKIRASQHFIWHCLKKTHVMTLQLKMLKMIRNIIASIKNYITNSLSRKKKKKTFFLYTMVPDLKEFDCELKLGWYTKK